MVASVWLIILLISSTSNAAVEKDFRKISFNDVMTYGLIEFNAPGNKYVFYDIDNGWNIINTYFWKNINFKLNLCDAREEFVDPVKDNIINNPLALKWYQEPVVIIWGVPVIFTAGFALGFLLAK